MLKRARTVRATLAAGAPDPRLVLADGALNAMPSASEPLLNGLASNADSYAIE